MDKNENRLLSLVGLVQSSVHEVDNVGSVF